MTASSLHDVERALLAAAGVEGIDIDLREGSICITHDPETIDVHALVKVVTAAQDGSELHR